MHTQYLQKGLLAGALACAFAAAPLSQVLAQEVGQQAAGSPASQTQSDTMHQSDNQTLPGKANDGWITTKVKSKLAAAKNLKSTDISVETTEGMVTLTGTVPTTSAKNHAVREAKSVKGVKSVDATGLTVSGS